MSTTVGTFIRAMESIAPPSLAEPWDNTGLILGDPDRAVPDGASVLLCIDLTEAVSDEALRQGFSGIVAYHPPVFTGIKRITAMSAQGRTLLRLAERGVWVYCPHTALDAAPGGVTDWLIGLACPGIPARPIQASGAGSGGFKVVVFVPAVPPEVLDRVRSAMSAAGAGVIGAYSACSFTSPGTGTFFGGEGASPAVGLAGRLESVSELRLEMVCPSDERTLAAVIGAMRSAHPYESPAFDILALHAPPSDPAPGMPGAGRLVCLDTPVRPSLIAERLSRALGSDADVQVGARSDDPVNRVAAVPGSGASLLDAAIGAGAGVFITGEMKHHDVLSAVQRGCAVVLAGHTQSERGFLPELARRLAEAIPNIRPVVSTSDTPPLRRPAGTPRLG